MSKMLTLRLYDVWYSPVRALTLRLDECYPGYKETRAVVRAARLPDGRIKYGFSPVVGKPTTGIVPGLPRLVDVLHDLIEETFGAEYEINYSGYDTEKLYLAPLGEG